MTIDVGFMVLFLIYCTNGFANTLCFVAVLLNSGMRGRTPCDTRAVMNVVLCDPYQLLFYLT